MINYRVRVFVFGNFQLTFERSGNNNEDDNAHVDESENVVYSGRRTHSKTEQSYKNELVD